MMNGNGKPGGGLILPPGMERAPIIGEQEQWGLTPMLRWNKEGKLQQMIISQKTQEKRFVDVPTEAAPAPAPIPSAGEG